jgi:hypothetical protein
MKPSLSSFYLKIQETNSLLYQLQIMLFSYSNQFKILSINCYAVVFTVITKWREMYHKISVSRTYMTVLKIGMIELKIYQEMIYWNDMIERYLWRHTLKICIRDLLSLMYTFLRDFPPACLIPKQLLTFTQPFYLHLLW